MNNKPSLLTIKEARAKGLWFASKRYGYGWVPITWQGWTVTLAFVAIIVAIAYFTIETPEPTLYEVLLFFKALVLSVFLLIYICYRKGEKAYWRWGK